MGSPLRRIAAWLEPQSVMLNVDVRDRRQALEVAAATIARMRSIDDAPVFRALWRRELVGSTALGQGIAIPHARIGGIDRPLTLYMRPKSAIEFDAPDGEPVGNILFVLVPSGGDTDEHLQFLALVAEMFSDADMPSRLARVADVSETRMVFAEAAQRIG
jgi:PTS system nitrogen regulatory IIA component